MTVNDTSSGSWGVPGGLWARQGLGLDHMVMIPERQSVPPTLLVAMHPCGPQNLPPSRCQEGSVDPVTGQHF